MKKMTALAGQAKRQGRQGIISGMGMLCAAAVMGFIFFGQAMHVSAEQDAKGRITVINRDGSGDTEPIPDAVFICCQVMSLKTAVTENGISQRSVPLLVGSDGQEIQVTEETDPGELAKAALKMHEEKTLKGVFLTSKTDADGIAGFEKLPDGIYLICETEAGADHLPSAPFLITVPSASETASGNTEAGLSYAVTAEPKTQPCGILNVSKDVAGNAAEKNRAFRFSAEFENIESCRFTASDGTEGMYKSGDEFTLKAGESIRFSLLPAGTAYAVRELDENSYGYTTESTGTKGMIRSKLESLAAFLNKRYQETDTPGTPVQTSDLQKPERWLLLAVLCVSVLSALGLEEKQRKR